jgi:hypothetical protein
MNNYYTATELKVRRWTSTAIVRFAGPPDMTGPNPCHETGAPMRFWLRERITHIEETQEFVLWKAGSDKRRSTRQIPIETEFLTGSAGTGKTYEVQARRSAVTSDSRVATDGGLWNSHVGNSRILQPNRGDAPRRFMPYISRRALLQRINRRLASHNRKLHYSNGWFHILDISDPARVHSTGQTIAATNIELVDFARTLGILARVAE